MESYSSPGHSTARPEWTQGLTLGAVCQDEHRDPSDLGSRVTQLVESGPFPSQQSRPHFSPQWAQETEWDWNCCGFTLGPGGRCGRSRASKSQAGQAPPPQTTAEKELGAESTVRGY